ncbi:DUF1330 domain-containing protein [Streptomyces sp. S465]|uniref:DUF1330 domain-containing protein n=1 Tax=Streptomyces sp. S465 TaxID=2979468 RepID=UPI0022A8BB49|nr:DUF1330 domain-containing protein [Streptomyces sp. S465]WAP57988.1 DUF1330 domain-containing protein [Streptomyces sp. S465]
MAAYVISEVEILNQTLANEYKMLAEASIHRHGGRYVVRGVQPDPVEGAWSPRRRLVIVEFPDMDRARKWYESPEYAEALSLRQAALDRRLLFVEDLPE